MGVTIHYRGKLKSVDLISTFMDEVEEICISNNWKYQLLNEDMPVIISAADAPMPFNDDNDFEDDGFPHDLRGISFEPHEESESVIFLFNPRTHCAARSRRDWAPARALLCEQR